MHVLYVDGHKKTREELEEQLGYIAPEWQFTITSTLDDAERLLQSETIDALICRSDVNGQDADGLLRLSSEIHPYAVRILVEDTHRPRDIFLPATLAHRYLLSPVEPVQLVSAVEGPADMLSEIYSEALQKVIIKMSKLPSPPTLYSEVVNGISSPTGTLNDVSRIISKDASTSAKIVQLANSPFFGFTTRILDLSHAVFVLGMNTITGFVLVNGIVSDSKVFAASGVDPDRFLEHSVDVGLIARAIAIEKNMPLEIVDMAYVSGLLHDIGRLFLAGSFSEDMATVSGLVQYRQLRVDVAEDMVFGATHSQVGASMLGLWDLPSEIIEAVLLHHRPDRSSDVTFSPLTAVHVAKAIVNKYESGITNSSLDIDTAYLSGLGLLQKVDQWVHKYKNIDHTQRDPQRSA